MQPADYDRFKPFFSQVLADYHNVAVDATHTNNWDLSGVAGLPEDGKLDLAALGLPPLSMRVRVGRNLADFPLPGAMSKEDRVTLEAKVRDGMVGCSGESTYMVALRCVRPSTSSRPCRSTVEGTTR